MLINFAFDNLNIINPEIHHEHKSVCVGSRHVRGSSGWALIL